MMQRMVNQLLGGNNGICCKYCHLIMHLFGHADDCILNKINPMTLINDKEEMKKLLKKQANKQRVFKNDTRHAHQRTTTVTKPIPRKKSPAQELMWCGRCSMKRIHYPLNKRWCCTACTGS